MANRLLVVDDDPALRSLLSEYLGGNGYTVVAVGDGSAMRKAMAGEAFDLVILDLMLPGEDGLSLCRDLRARSGVPVIMLTARGDELDRIIGLEMGADDYLPKPFNPRELLARIKSIARRAQSGGDTAARPHRLRFAGWILDLAAHHLVDGAGVVSPMPQGEFRLLQALVEHPQRVQNREYLTEVLANRESLPFDRTIDVMIGRLRRRLGDDGREPALIKTVRNEGYLFAGEVERQQ